MNWKHVVVGAVFALGCSKEAPVEIAPQKVVAVVNGRSLSDSELQLRRDKQLGREEALETLITLELQAQKAEAEGLHLTADFANEMEVHQARLRDARRLKLARAWRLKTLGQLPAVDERDVTAWVEQHQDLVKSEWRLRRVDVASKDEAQKAIAAIQGGTPIATVAASFSNQPVELGPLAFDALPDAWWAALEHLQVGQLTEALPMGNRFVVLELVSKTAGAMPDAQLVRTRVLGVLQARAYEERVRKLGDELKQGALIEKRAAPPVAPPPSLEE